MLTLLEAQNTSNYCRTGSFHTAQQQAGSLTDWADSGLRNRRTVGETDSPTTWSAPDFSEPVSDGRNNDIK